MYSEDNFEQMEERLLLQLQEAEEPVKDESAWMSLVEVKAAIGVW